MPSTSPSAAERDRHAGTVGRLANARTVAEVVRIVVDSANDLHNLPLSGYAIEDGICVLLTSNGPVDTSVVSRSITSGDIVSDGGILAVPVMVEDVPVAVLSSAARIGGADVQPYVEFLADAAAASISHVRAMLFLERSGVLSGIEGDLRPGHHHPTPFRALFDSADTMCWILDAKGRVIYVNPFTARITGIEADAYLGERFWNLPLRDGLEPKTEEIRAYQQRIIGGESCSGEIDLKMGDGAVRVVRFNLSPLRGVDGHIEFVLATAVDVTDQREAEQALRAMNDALEMARIEAERSATARTEFLASMSHEIRTPLNAIIGTTTLLLDRGADDLTTEHAEILRSSGEHLLAVINDILDMSKLDTGSMEIDDDRFAVEALVESSLDLVMGSAAHKGLEVTSIVEPGTPDHLCGDAPRLRQVLVNLLANAVKYTNEGVVELICRGHYVGTERVELVIEVRDTGPGIEPHELETLFEPFVQAESGRIASDGSGLGLSISERLVRMLGGTITVHSTVGVGTTFTVSVPFDVDTSVHAVQPVPEPTGLDGLAVLVVDDIEINRRVLELETKRWGMVPTLCASPLDALALVDGGRRFDIALLDLNMPEMDGDELAAALRERHPCPMVLLSSTDYQDDGRGLFGARLHKPIKRHQLAAAIEQALGHTTNAALAPSPRSDPSPLRILVAEDNVVNQKVARALLNRLGHDPDVVSDGIEVMKVLEIDAYDLVLLDLRMPGIDGIETASQIIERYGNRRPRLVALTASATEDDRQHCLEAGMDDFVTKPVTLDSLARVVADAQRANPGGRWPSVGAGPR